MVTALAPLCGIFLALYVHSAVELNPKGHASDENGVITCKPQYPWYIGR